MTRDAALLAEEDEAPAPTEAEPAKAGATDRIESIFVVAASAQSRCGVYDYTAKLARAIRERGREATLVPLGDWSFATTWKLIKRFRNRRGVALHVQYPSVDMGSSIFPALLPLLLRPAPVFLTLHEFSIFSLPRKLVFWSYAKFAKAIFFSNDYERDAFASFFKDSFERLHVLPIGSNIEGTAGALLPLDKRPPKLVYFGQISENKGIEIFLETVAKLRKSGLAFQPVIIGAVMDRQSALMNEITAAATRDAIDLRFDLPSDDVVKELASARLALLPFPDGISDKRGSALACLNFGAVVATRHSSKTPQWLKQATLPITDSDDSATLAAEVLADPLHAGVDWEIAKSELLRRRWPTIAQEHIDFYENTSA